MRTKLLTKQADKPFQSVRFRFIGLRYAIWHSPNVSAPFADILEGRPQYLKQTNFERAAARLYYVRFKIFGGLA